MANKRISLRELLFNKQFLIIIFPCLHKVDEVNFGFRFYR